METLSKIRELCEKHLTQGEIDRLILYLQTLRARKALVDQVKLWQEEIPVRPGWEVIEEKRSDYVTYRRERIRCGEQEFKCNMGLLDGPFWYAYFKRDNRLISKYIGKHFRPISPIAEQVKMKSGRLFQK
jgi:hypothetical protein